MESNILLNKDEIGFWKKTFIFVLVLGLTIFVSGILSSNTLAKVFYAVIGLIEIIGAVFALTKLKKPEDIIITNWFVFAVAVGFLLIVLGPSYRTSSTLMAIATIAASLAAIIGLYGILHTAKKYNLPVAP